MSVRINCWCCIRLTQKIDYDICLWEEAIPQRKGKSSATLARTLRKCALKCRIATSDALRRWQPGGTNSNFIFYLSRMTSFIACKTSLLRTCFLGTIPAFLSRITNTWYVRVNFESFRIFSGSTRMALLLISTITMRYLLPRWDFWGNFPVWSDFFPGHRTLLWTHRAVSYPAKSSHRRFWEGVVPAWCFGRFFRLV